MASSDKAHDSEIRKFRIFALINMAVIDVITILIFVLLRKLNLVEEYESTDVTYCMLLSIGLYSLVMLLVIAFPKAAIKSIGDEWEYTFGFLYGASLLIPYVLMYIITSTREGSFHVLGLILYTLLPGAILAGIGFGAGWLVALITLARFEPGSEDPATGKRPYRPMSESELARARERESYRIYEAAEHTVQDLRTQLEQLEQRRGSMGSEQFDAEYHDLQTKLTIESNRRDLCREQWKEDNSKI